MEREEAIKILGRYQYLDKALMFKSTVSEEEWAEKRYLKEQIISAMTEEG